MSSEPELAILWWWHRRRKCSQKKYWAQSPFSELTPHNSSILAKELNNHPDLFKSHYGMSTDNFKSLLKLVGSQITKADTNCRMAIRPADKLLITLRYLTTGLSFRALSQMYKKGDNTIGVIIRDSAIAIWQCLQPEYMAVPTASMWKFIAKRYYEMWDLPNCIGAIGQKHIRIKRFSGSESPNKGYYTVVLIVNTDVDGLFLTIHAGDIGKNTTGAMFRASCLETWLDNDRLNIPNPSRMPNDSIGKPFPYYFVADEVFPLRKNVMRPFPQRIVNDDRKVFNDRISQGKNSIRNAFDMFESKFPLFNSPMRCQVSLAISVVKAACVLHNFILLTDENFSSLADRKSTPFANVSRESESNSSCKETSQEIRNRLQTYFLNNPIPYRENYYE